MFGRFFALELGCPEEDTTVYMNSDGSISPVPESPDQAPEGVSMICECRGLGCNKCKRKKAKVVTLTGASGAVPVMNIQPMQMPLAPWTPGMVMMGRSSIF
jgi:hypothetical protein